MTIETVYFIQAESGPVKIGYSSDVPQRLAQLQSGMREIMTLKATVSGDRALENYFHQTLRQSRVIGEWFSPTPMVIETIQAVAERGLAAVPPEYRPRPEYEPQDMRDDDDLLCECREYIIAIGGPRIGADRVMDMLGRVSKITGIGLRRVRGIWNRECRILEASEYIRLRECFEANEAIRIEREDRLRAADRMLSAALGAPVEAKR